MPPAISQKATCRGLSHLPRQGVSVIVAPDAQAP
jgi:hypothetical protein